jgi:hypothetical protein
MFSLASHSNFPHQSNVSPFLPFSLPTFLPPPLSYFRKNAHKLLLLVKLLNKLLSKLRLQLLKQPRLSKKPKLLLMNLRLKLMVLVRV